jgi:branched-chain amino acid transport system permease protein
VYELVQHLINGLAAGTIYALVALGYTMVYGVLKLINFAHGDVMMVGVYVGYADGVSARPREAGHLVPAALLVFCRGAGRLRRLGLHHRALCLPPAARQATV